MNGEKFFIQYTVKKKCRKTQIKKGYRFIFLSGNAGSKTAIINAGGGFVYVAGIHDSFPHALELSKKGYNAFALIYRPGAQTACEDLARAIAFLHEKCRAITD